MTWIRIPSGYQKCWFFLARLRTHRHRLNQMDLALSTHYTHWQSPVEWWNDCPPIFYKPPVHPYKWHIFIYILYTKFHQETKEKTLVVPKYVPKIVESKPIHVAVHQPPKTPGWLTGGGVEGGCRWTRRVFLMKRLRKSRNKYGDWDSSWLHFIMDSYKLSFII